MATYAIGDIQGCWVTFQALLDRIGFDPAVDRVWLVGDLVNRGPASAEVLRWAARHEDVVTAVLGNHDLHLLATAAGHRKPGRRDTLDDVLTAPDRDELLAWLRAQPLLHREGAHLMVHAGLAPGWSLEEAHRKASEIYDTILGVLEIARDEGIPSYKAADRLAERRIDDAKQRAMAKA